MIDGKTLGVAKMVEQLQEMYEEVKKIIDNGDVEGARDIIEANFNALREQSELGVEGIEHATMLDIMAQLHLTLGDFEKVEHFLLEVSYSYLFHAMLFWVAMLTWVSSLIHHFFSCNKIEVLTTGN